MNLIDVELFKQNCLIDGVWEDSKEIIEVVDPSDRSLLGTVPNMGSQETKKAIKAATKALAEWKGKSAKERSVILKNWANMVVESSDDLALIMTREQGKPLAEAKGEVLSGAAYMEWFAEEAKRVYGDTIPISEKDKRIVVLKEPVGVCGAITPWNFPSSMIARKTAPALAAGCSVVVKPASRTPFSALALAELSQRAGMPKGVFNVITGSAQQISQELLASNDVRKLSFTGSTEVGKILMQGSASNVKKISLELGGHAPFIVFDDANIEDAVEGALTSKFRNSGQTCVCANRFFIHESIYDEFAKKFIKSVSYNLKCGPGNSKENNQGPLIDHNALVKVEDHIKDALAKGAKLLLGGKRIDGKGYFYEPTILGNISSEMKIFREETFGPVAPLIKFKTEEEVIAMANDSIYGLASYFYSENYGRVWRVSESLEYGMVGVNTGLLSSESAPFGGIKESGLGREGSHYGIDEYIEQKYLCLGGL